MRNEKIIESIQEAVLNSEMSEADKNIMLKNLLKIKDQKVNIMITGATGCGKSSTINALFNMEVAKVGVGVDPETMEIEKYELDNLVIWDTPGLGDGKEADNRHAKNIIRKLSELDSNGNALIDLVVVVLDGSSRDLGTAYELINEVIIPNLGEEKSRRILVAINQADMAMKGRNWDFENNKPMQPLVDFLEEKAESIRKRVLEATGVEVEPIYYAAGYKEEGCAQCRPYNLSKLLYYIINAIPAEKRLVVATNTNKEPEMWKDDDERIEYRKEIQSSILESITNGIETGADIGGSIGSVFGKGGEAVGRVIGGIVGGACGFIGEVIRGGRSRGPFGGGLSGGLFGGGRSGGLFGGGGWF